MSKRIHTYEAAAIALSAVAVCVVLALGGPGPGIYPDEGAAAPREDFQASDGRININSADAEALELLPGIGPVKAEAILAHKAKYGDFKSEYQLLAVPGIDMDTLNGFIDYICVEDYYEDTGG